MRVMNSWALASLAASMISSSVASGRPKAMLSAHGSAQQHRVLQDEADLAAQSAKLVVADVHAVDRDRPASGSRKRGMRLTTVDLPLPVGADDADHLARLDGERDVAKHRKLRDRSRMPRVRR